MVADNIRMRVDDVLELEYLVEEVTRDTIQVNSQNDSEINYISTIQAYSTCWSFRFS